MKYSRIIFFLILATLATAYARTAQLLYLTEPKSGFFSPDGKTIALALMAFIILTIFAASVMTCFTRRSPSGAPDKSLVAHIGAIILAVACIFDAVAISYTAATPILVLLTQFFAVLAFLSLLLYTLRLYIPVLSKFSKMFYIPLVIFFAFKLVSSFTVYAAVSIIADNVLSIALLCFALLFVLYFLKLENGISPGRSAYRLFPLSVATFILGTCCTVPQIILLVLGKNELVHSEPTSLVLPAATSIFALCYTLSLYGKKNILRRKRNTPKLESDTSYHEMSGQFVSGSGKHRHKR